MSVHVHGRSRSFYASAAVAIHSQCSGSSMCSHTLHARAWRSTTAGANSFGTALHCTAWPLVDAWLCAKTFKSSRAHTPRTSHARTPRSALHAPCTSPTRITHTHCVHALAPCSSRDSLISTPHSRTLMIPIVAGRRQDGGHPGRTFIASARQRFSGRSEPSSSALASSLHRLLMT
jgi:hypothetical protein